MKLKPLSTVAHQRLYPSLTDPSYLVLRARRLKFAEWAGQLGPGPLTILDVGARYQPYRPLFEGRIGQYVAVDLIKTDLVSVVADGEALPFAAGTFDVVIATQVFDYFRDPVAAAKLMWDVLKPGGVLLASFPSLLPPFAAGEKWRFTAAGIRSCLEPFGCVELIPEVHSPASAFRSMNLMIDTLVGYNLLRRTFRLTICPVSNLVGLGLEKLNLTADDQFTGNYSVRAVKAKLGRDSN